MDRTLVELHALEQAWVDYGQRVAETRQPVPLIKQLETTSRCNIKCVFCPHSEMTRANESMDLDALKSFLHDQCTHVKNLGLNHYGEPFLHPGNAEIVEFASGLGIEVSFSTNGTMITPQRARDVIRAGLARIIFSLDGLQPDTFNRLRVGADLEQVEANIHVFLDAKNAVGRVDGPYVQIQFIETPENSEEWPAFLDKWSLVAGVDQVIRRSETTHAGAVVRHGEYSERAQHRQACRYLWESVVVTADGTVVPCCKDYDAAEPLGNVFKGDSLEAIWNGRRLRELRRAHAAGRFEESRLCAGCDEWTGHPAMSPEESLSALSEHLQTVAAERSVAVYLRDRGQR